MIEDALDMIRIYVKMSKLMEALDPDDRISRYFVTAKRLVFNDETDDLEDEVPVARAEVIPFHPAIFDEEWVLDICDADSGDLEDFYSTVYEEDWKLKFPLATLRGYSLLINELEFMDSDKELACKFLQWITANLGIGLDVAFIFPIVTEYEVKPEITRITYPDKPKKLKWLKSVLSDCGFHQFGKTKYMFWYFNES